MKIPDSGPRLQSILESRKSLPFDEETRRCSKEFNDRYLHWDDLKYREFGSTSREDVWALMKILRSLTATEVSIGKFHFTYNVPTEFQRMLHDIDTRISSGLVSSDKLDDNRGVSLSVSSMMEESIASSQLEGASTTTKLAKKLLRENSAPENLSQQMIVNNYRAMQFIKNNTDKRLSAELIRSIHKIVSHDTLEDASFEGEFRTDDDIAVRDRYEDVTYYHPICHNDIGPTVDDLCRYVNDDTTFVHPIVKGIILHFVLAYIHPFVDGNGRVSRSLFYWYAMKHGYSMIEFLSVSKVIKSHRQKYDLAYLRTETDENDLTYFIQYNLVAVMESIDVFSRYLERKSQERKKALDELQGSGLNLRQSEILRHLIKSEEPVSVHELAVKYQATQTTVRRDLLKMVEMGYVVYSGKDGYRQLYRYSGKRGV